MGRTARGAVDRRFTALGRNSGPNPSARIVHRTMKRAPHDRDEPAARPPAGRRSRATIAAELQAELDGARVFQLYARKLGPSDVTYVSAMAMDPRNRVVEVKATGSSRRADPAVRRRRPGRHPRHRSGGSMNTEHLYDPAKNRFGHSIGSTPLRRVWVLIL